MSYRMMPAAREGDGVSERSWSAETVDGAAQDPADSDGWSDLWQDDVFLGGRTADPFAAAAESLAAVLGLGESAPSGRGFDTGAGAVAPSVIDEFRPGPGGDVMRLGALASLLADRFGALPNPFAAGFLRLDQADTDVRLIFSPDGVTAPHTERVLVVFRGLDAARLTVDNFAWDEDPFAPLPVTRISAGEDRRVVVDPGRSDHPAPDIWADFRPGEGGDIIDTEGLRSVYGLAGETDPWRAGGCMRAVARGRDTVIELNRGRLGAREDWIPMVVLAGVRPGELTRFNLPLWRS
ncbi:hypothetical protein [Prosthecomicrobium pneumaticum]|uniref:Uncharacterized protein n=1 Tax=Prosthecomicrobium pneumaticum TaxID=81895 RepID=A0A7W9FPY5_9HYPH|nr:hypothetical protein [Prosthecomicrobium pneumaticum]MBB5754650.1 hypothetical protein [Prosthecomicrobium pneumaticum]